MTRLFHVSENPAIDIFSPRPAPNEDAGVTGSAVWAIDEKHLANYLLPRNCPRIAYGISESTSQSDKNRFFPKYKDNQRTILVEQCWLEAIRNATLFLYEFNSTNFQLVDQGAGYYISREIETPISCHKIKNLITEMKIRDVQLGYVPNLWDMIEQVSQSTLEFSIIRKRNAQPKPGAVADNV